MIATAKKLAQVQASLKAPKGQRNTFGKYNFRSCSDIVEYFKTTVKALGYAEDVYLLLEDKIELVGDRYYVKATVTFHDSETGGTGISSYAYARESFDKKGMDDSQITGAASSYARKYALCGLLAIDDTDDADATNDHGKGHSVPAKTPLAEKAIPSARVDGKPENINGSASAGTGNQALVSGPTSTFTAPNPSQVTETTPKSNSGFKRTTAPTKEVAPPVKEVEDDGWK